MGPLIHSENFIKFFVAYGIMHIHIGMHVFGYGKRLACIAYFCLLVLFFINNLISDLKHHICCRIKNIHFYTLFLVIKLVVYIVASKSYAWENPSLILTYARARPIDCNYSLVEPIDCNCSLVDVKNPTSRPLCQMKTYEPKFHTCHEYKFIIFTYVAQSV